MNSSDYLTLAIIVALFTLFFGAGCSNSVSTFDAYLKKKYQRKGFSSDTLETRGFNVHYWDNHKEDAPTLLFVHGFGGDGKVSWFKQAFDLHKDYRIVIPDLLWFGKSKSEKEPSLASQIKALSLLIDSLNLEKVHLVGISYGGFVSLGLAQRHPEKFNSLTIVDSPGTTVSDQDMEEFCRSVGAESIKDAFIPENKEEVKRLLNFSFYNPPALPGFVRKQTLGSYFSRHPEKQAQLLDELPENRNTMDNTVSIPTLILWGKEDKVFDVQLAKKLQEQLNAKLIVIEKAGHALPGEKPKAFNQHLDSFVRSIN
ncbi:MAG: alpha/beta hydrolase [Brumimicrobium sp.]|nr:alpha/beta hydrolase [Brumimicrobium sp.]